MNAKYTVVLRYPEHIDPMETYVAWVEASDSETAIAFAQEDLMDENYELDIDDVREAKPIAIFLGYLNDLYKGHQP